ncbi:glutathione S-transferase family protein [Frigidibacter sp. ROC022]|uniref:glutathione S-transferase family protein n=1 Tax=Frigidibacter sp. ROC022 TaxID=2971796 RepID=UPI00215A7184|nr:glutathione S-transferase [Frigidibacter sp. ROC022]MCR8723549.1 glutathione S-transferase [Frigidibacter sp. ROC022]
MIRLHHIPQARSFRTLWLLEEMGLEFEVVEHSIFDRSLRDPDYLALSPAGRVPALEIDGLVLFESGAITEYLCETRPGFAPAPGAAGRADWLEWLHFAETIGQHCANLTQNHIVLREDWMRSPTLMKLEARRLAACLAVVDKAVARQDWLLPGGFSAVDTNVGYGIEVARRFVELTPAVQDYRARYRERPAFARAAARDGVPQLYTRDFYPVPDA